MRQTRLKFPFCVLQAFSRVVLSRFFQFEVRGASHIANLSGPLILAGNHTGLLDGLVVLAAFNRPFDFLMSDTVLNWRIIGKIMPYANVIPLPTGREGRALVPVVQSLRQDAVICIFPEGKLTLDGELLPFNEGAAFLQEKSGAPIVPFAIHGGFEAWAFPKKWPTFRKVTVSFGSPLLPGEGNRSEVTCRLRERVRLMKELMAAEACLSAMSARLADVV